MAFTKLQIVNQACLKLGQKEVTSLNESKFSIQASNLFDVIVESDITSSNFTFAQKWTQLSLLPEAPAFPGWLYAYALPQDYRYAIDINPRVPYDIVANRTLYINFKNQYTPLYMKYIFLPEPQYFPASYVRYLASAIAADLALSSNVSESIYGTLRGEAANFSAIAKSTDAQTRPNNSINNSRWLNPRKSYPGGYPLFNFYSGG